MQSGLVSDVRLTVCVWSVSPACVSVFIKWGWWFWAFPPLLTCCSDHVFVLVYLESALEIVLPCALVGLVKCAVTAEGINPPSLDKWNFQITWNSEPAHVSSELAQGAVPNLISYWLVKPNLTAWQNLRPDKSLILQNPACQQNSWDPIWVMMASLNWQTLAFIWIEGVRC